MTIELKDEQKRRVREIADKAFPNQLRAEICKAAIRQALEEIGAQMVADALWESGNKLMEQADAIRARSKTT